ncbi:MAG: hypothetical protein GY730_09905 [bacterium]|nr:hypothetical protein [bacterium]
MTSKFNRLIVSCFISTLILFSCSGTWFIPQSIRTLVWHIKAGFNYDTQRIIKFPGIKSIPKIAQYLPKDKSYKLEINSNSRIGPISSYFLPSSKIDPTNTNIKISYLENTDQPVNSGCRTSNLDTAANKYRYKINNNTWIKSNIQLKKASKIEKFFGINKLSTIKQNLLLVSGFAVWLLACISMGYLFFQLTKNKTVKASWLGPVIITGNIQCVFICWLLLQAGISLKYAASVSFIVLPVIAFIKLVSIKKIKDLLSKVKEINWRKIKLSYNKLNIIEKNIVAWTGIVLICYIIYTYLGAVTSYDCFGHWLVKAKCFFINSKISYPLRNTYPVYPTFWPLLNSALYALTNSVILEFGRWISGVLYFSFIHTIYCLLKYLKYSTKFSFLFSCCFIIFFLDRHYSFAMAEAVLISAFFLSSFILVDVCLSLRNRHLPLSGLIWLSLLCTGTSMVKLEGSVYILITIFSGIIFLAVNKNIKQSLPLLLAILPAVLVLSIHLLNYNFVININNIYSNPHNGAVVLSLSHLYSFGKQFIIWLTRYRIKGIIFGAGLLISIVIFAEKKGKTPLVFDEAGIIFFLISTGCILFVPISVISWKIAAPSAYNTALERIVINSYPFLTIGLIQVLKNIKKNIRLDQ